ncbi:MAG: hypothetical protein ACI9QC_000670 [Oceanicoccus sp.]
MFIHDETTLSVDSNSVNQRFPLMPLFRVAVIVIRK